MNGSLTCAAENLEIEKFPNLLRFYKVWEGYCGHKFAPSWSEFDFMDFPLDLIPYIFILNVHVNIQNDFRYRFIGTKVVEIEGHDYTGCSVDELQFAGGEKSFRAQFEAFIADPVPMFYAARTENEIGHLSTLYSGLRLPISNDGKTVDKILCMAQYETEKHSLIETMKSLKNKH